MKAPSIPISWGELFDKLTILQIKLENLQDKNALKNVKIEYNQLYIIYNKNFLENEKAKLFMINLKKINNKLWNIEDEIREKEKNKTFDEEFIKLARNVYITNDQRSYVKKKINKTFNSEIIEEKSYQDY